MLKFLRLSVEINEPKPCNSVPGFYILSPGLFTVMNLPHEISYSDNTYQVLMAKQIFVYELKLSESYNLEIKIGEILTFR